MRKRNKVPVLLRDAQALELRKQGLQYHEIASRMGYAQKSGAHHAVQRALRAALADRDEDAEDVRALEIQRLDDLLQGLWNKAIGGNPQAIDRVLRIMERRALYLGLDEPKKQEITGPNGGAIQIEQTVDVNVSLEERNRRILAIVEQARARTDLIALPGGSDMAPTAGSTAESVADTG